MTNLNRYADAILTDTPSAIWTFDDLNATIAAATPTDLDTTNNIALANMYGVASSAYSSVLNPAYYISQSSSAGQLKVSNVGIPLVYGATQVSNVLENTLSSVSYPSIIVPGFGFFNENGRTKKTALEFWMRAKAFSHYPRKIVGPIASADGLYIDGPFIKLKINDIIASHYVGNQNRPFHIVINYSPSNASLIVNGEQVISINYSVNEISFPTALDTNSDSQDYIGFYAYSNIPVLQIDCVAIYPYMLSSETAKLHFVKGQSVDSPELKQGKYLSTPIVFDYQMAKSANNYTYPGTGRFENGFINNMSVQNNAILPPLYSLPSIVFQEPRKTLSQWYESQNETANQSVTTSLSTGKLINDNVFFRINPKDSGNEWDSEGYILFERFNEIIQNPVKAFYGVFETDDLPANNQEEVLFRLVNNSGQYLECVLSDDAGDLIYRFYYPNETSQSNLLTIKTLSAAVDANPRTEGDTANYRFAVGINFDTLIAQQASNDYLTSFLSNQSELKLFIGGSSAFDKTFNGQIYKFGFADEKNLSLISSYFTSDGIADNSDVLSLNSHFATYTLFGINTLGTFALDIATSGSWEDYVPLSVLAKNVIADSSGNFEYKLDQIQISLDYLENSDLTNSMIRSYVEFSEIATSIVSSLQTTKSLESYGGQYVVEPDSNWLNKRYEIVNNSIVRLPTGGYGDIEDLGINIYIDFKIPGIIRNPVTFKNLQIGSYALNYSAMRTPIGSKFGKDVFPYTKTATVVDSVVTAVSVAFNGKNPFRLHKQSTPYLYLTDSSGIQMVGTGFGDNTNSKIEKRGILVPINEERQLSYQLSLIQMSVLFNKNFSETLELCRIKNELTGKTVVIYAEYSSALVATLTAKTLNTAQTGYDTTNPVAVSFFVNGLSTTSLQSNKWNMVAIQFSKAFDLSNGYGSLSLTGPFVYNSIADYRVSETRINSTFIYDTWGNVFTNSGGESGDWTAAYEYEEDATPEWEDILISSEVGTPVRIDAASLYASYLGNSSISALDDSWITVFNDTSFNYYAGIRVDGFRGEPL